MIPTGWTLDRDVVARAIATEIAAGRGTAHGGVCLDVTHLPREQIETPSGMLEQFLEFGVDIRTTPMEVAPTAHHVMGGLRSPRADDCAGVSLPAARRPAESGCKPAGRKCPCRDTGLWKRAGEFAGKTGKRVKRSNRQISQAESDLTGSLRDREPCRVRRDLEHAMWEGAGIFRNGQTENALAMANRLCRPRSGRYPRNLAECCIVQTCACGLAHLPERPDPARVPGGTRKDRYYAGMGRGAFTVRPHVHFEVSRGNRKQEVAA